MQKSLDRIKNSLNAPVLTIAPAGKQIDLFSLLQSYRCIADSEERKEQADDLFKKTGDIEKVDKFCQSFVLADKAKKLFESSKINKRFLRSTFENYKTSNENQNEALAKAINYFKEIETHLEKGTNLIFAGYGCVGTGKTHLANSVGHALMTQKGIPCKFINVVSMIAELKESFDIKEYTDIEVLIIDDLGKEKGTPWVCEQIYAIINSRYEQLKPTIITTENDIVTLKNNYGEKGKAILSRLTEEFILIKLAGEDFRQKR